MDKTETVDGTRLAWAVGVFFLLIVFGIFALTVRGNHQSIIKNQEEMNIAKQATVTTSLNISGGYATVTAVIKNNATKPIEKGLGVYLKDINGVEHLLGYVNILVEPNTVKYGTVSKKVSDIGGPGPYIVVTKW